MNTPLESSKTEKFSESIDINEFRRIKSEENNDKRSIKKEVSIENQITKGKKRNTPATAGATFGILSIFLFELSIFPLLAIIFSIVGLKKAKELNGFGRGNAVVGLVLGIIYMLATIFLVPHRTSPLF